MRFDVVPDRIGEKTIALSPNPSDLQIRIWKDDRSTK